MRLVKIALGSVNTTVGAVDANTQHVARLAREMAREDVTVGCFPEQILGGYPPEDLIQWRPFLEAQRGALERIAAETKALPAVYVLGVAVSVGGQLFNTAAVVHRGRILGLVPKQQLPTYGVFYEARTFSRGAPGLLLDADGIALGDRLFEFDFGTLAVELQRCDVFASLSLLWSDARVARGGRRRRKEASVEEKFQFGPRYRDRTDAGRALAEGLGAYRGKDVLILGIPRGGVPVAAEVARGLNADLDVIVARKLGARAQPELAIGAVTANGGEFLNKEILDYVGASEDYVQCVRAEQMQEALRRETRFRGDRPAERISGRVVIVVDDGLATGATMRAAVRSVRRHRPARLVVAVPVGSRDACAALREEADEVVCLSTPEPFAAVGYFYQNFEPTEDAQVESILREFRAGPGAAREAAASRRAETRWN